MAVEATLQSQIIRWLKSQGAYVIKTRAGMGTPVGTPDIIFLFEGAWGVIECKASKTAKFQTGQKQCLDKLAGWSPFVYVAYPENWSEIKKSLLLQFF
jgi:Holliday junction resolvase